VLAVMAKAPRAGQVKTRLCPPLSPDDDVDTAANLERLEASLAAPGPGARHTRRFLAERRAAVRP
jgi:glycosyltransferase A (GT-A) superfamily protein (DUF2064 family)